MENVLNFLPSNAVGAVQFDLKRGQHYMVTEAGIRKVDAQLGHAVTRGYLALQHRHVKVLRRRTWTIVLLVISSILLAVFR
jgi:hypothetical protein